MELKLVALFIALAVLSGCITLQGGCDRGFSADAPTGWENFSENASGVNFIRIGMNPIESPLITVSKTSGFNGEEYATLDDFVDSLLAVIETEEEFNNILRLYPNLDAQDVTATFDAGNSNAKLRFVVTKKSNGYFHIISLLSDNYSFEENNAAFEELLDSLKFGCD